MSTLLEVAHDLSSTLDAGELLVRVGRRVAAALGCEVVSTYQWDEGSERYLPTSLFGLPPDGVAELANLPLAAGAALSAQIMHGPVVSNPTRATICAPRSAPPRRQGFVAAPLRSSARHHGALSRRRSPRRHFDPAQADWLAAIGTSRDRARARHPTAVSRMRSSMARWRVGQSCSPVSTCRPARAVLPGHGRGPGPAPRTPYPGSATPPSAPWLPPVALGSTLPGDARGTHPAQRDRGPAGEIRRAPVLHSGRGDESPAAGLLRSRRSDRLRRWSSAAARRRDRRVAYRALRAR